MAGISQLSSKSLPTADKIQQGDSLTCRGISGSETHKLPEAKGVSVSSFAVSWAKKYYSTVAARENKALRQIPPIPESSYFEGFEGNRAKIVDKLTNTLKLASEIAWNRVEALLGEQIERHGLDASLINPLEIVADSR